MPKLIALTAETRGDVPEGVTHLVEVECKVGDIPPHFMTSDGIRIWMNDPKAGRPVTQDDIDLPVHFARAATPAEIAEGEGKDTGPSPPKHPGIKCMECDNSADGFISIGPLCREHLPAKRRRLSPTAPPSGEGEKPDPVDLIRERLGLHQHMTLADMANALPALIARKDRLLAAKDTEIARLKGKVADLEERHEGDLSWSVTLLSRAEAAESERTSLSSANARLREACQTVKTWWDRENAGSGVDRDKEGGEALWQAWWDENNRLCRMAEEQLRTALAATGGEG